MNCSQRNCIIGCYSKTDNILTWIIFIFFFFFCANAFFVRCVYIHSLTLSISSSHERLLVSASIAHFCHQADSFYFKLECQFSWWMRWWVSCGLNGQTSGVRYDDVDSLLTQQRWKFKCIGCGKIANEKKTTFLVPREKKNEISFNRCGRSKQTAQKMDCRLKWLYKHCFHSFAWAHFVSQTNM